VCFLFFCWLRWCAVVIVQGAPMQKLPATFLLLLLCEKMLPTVMGKAQRKKITESLKEKRQRLWWCCCCCCWCCWRWLDRKVKLVLVASRSHKLGHLLRQLERSIGGNQRWDQRWQQHTHNTHTHTHEHIPNFPRSVNWERHKRQPKLS